MDRWMELELFARSVEFGSLSKAAELLEVSNATASRGLASLEHRLDARLVDRGSRRFTLTEVGEEFYERCKSILADMDEAASAANAAASNPVGVLRVTSSLSFCTMHIAPLLKEFRKRYPKIAVHVEANNRYLDIIEAGIDVAVRTREYEVDPNMTTRRLAHVRRALVASPSYLAEHGTPHTPEELARHHFLTYRYASSPDVLRLSCHGDTRTVRVQPVLVSNDAAVVRVAALDGLGIIFPPVFNIHDDIQAGRLVPLLPGWELPPMSINLAYRNRQHLPAKVRVFVDFMIEYFRENDFDNKWMNSGEKPS